MEANGGVEIRFVQDTMALAHENGIGSEGEHFGFADPISQPPIEGADTPSYPGDGVLNEDGTWRPLKPGEFLLGYEDEAGPDRHADASSRSSCGSTERTWSSASSIRTLRRSGDTWRGRESALWVR